MTLLHQKNPRKGPFYHFVWSISPRFLTRFLKTWYGNYTSLQVQFDDAIGVSVKRNRLEFTAYIIHHENLRKRPNCHHFYLAYLLNFLLDSSKNLRWKLYSFIDTESGRALRTCLYQQKVREWICLATSVYFRVRAQFVNAGWNGRLCTIHLAFFWLVPLNRK